MTLVGATLLVIAVLLGYVIGAYRESEGRHEGVAWRNGPDA